MMHFLVDLLADTAYAQAGVAAPLPPCGSFANLFGCGGPTNLIGERVIPNLAVFFLRVVAAASVLFIVYSGISMMLAQDDTSKRDTARMGIVNAMLGLALALSAQLIVGWVATEDYGQGNSSDFVIGGLIKSAVRILLTLTNVILGILVIVQGFRMVAAQGKSDTFNNARSAIINAIMGAVVVNAALVLVRVVLTLFGV